MTDDMFGAIFGGGDDGENPMIDPNHPAVQRLLTELLQARSEVLQALESEVGADEAIDTINPQGIICGLMDAAVIQFTRNPIAAMLILSDRMTGAVRMQEGKPGKYLHQLSHLMFDLGRQYELELQKRGSGVADGEAPVEVSDLWKNALDDKQE